MSNLKAYRFIYRNPEMGITDQEGTTHWNPIIVVVIATNEEKAREFFQKKEDGIKATIRGYMAGKPASEVDKLIAEVTAKAELTVQEYELKDGLVL